MDENAIEKLLANDWSLGIRITTVPQAMRRLGLADDADARWLTADKLYGHWQSSLETQEKVREVTSAIGLNKSSDVEALSQSWIEQVVTWGRASILLTDNEKLVARHIWARHLQGLPLPRPEFTAAALNIPAPEVISGIQVLTRLGFLSLQENTPISGYTLAKDAERFLEGLGFFFHTVTLDDQETFGIP